MLGGRNVKESLFLDTHDVFLDVFGEAEDGVKSRAFTNDWDIHRLKRQNKSHYFELLL